MTLSCSSQKPRHPACTSFSFNHYILSSVKGCWIRLLNVSGLCPPLCLSDNALIQATVISSLDDSNNLLRDLPDSWPILSPECGQNNLSKLETTSNFPHFKSIHGSLGPSREKSKIIHMAYSTSCSWLYPPLHSHFNLCPLVSLLTPSSLLSVRLNPFHFPKHTSLVSLGLCLGSLFCGKLSSPGQLLVWEEWSVVPSTGTPACDAPSSPSFPVIIWFLVISSTR